MPHDLDDLVYRGVITFVALTGGICRDRPSRLWELAEAAGMPLDEFVQEIVRHTAPMAEYIRSSWDCADPET